MIPRFRHVEICHVSFRSRASNWSAVKFLLIFVLKLKFKQIVMMTC